MSKKILIAAVAAALSPAAVLANDVSYSYGEINYHEVDVGAGISDNGFGLAGSFAINDSWHAGLSYNTTSFGFGVDYDRTSLGFGYNGDFGTNASYFIDLAYEKIDLGIGGDDTGYSFQVGARGMVSDSFELQGQIGTIDIFGGSETTYGVSGRYFINDSMAIGLSWDTVDSGSGIDTLTLGFRFNF